MKGLVPHVALGLLGAAGASIAGFAAARGQGSLLLVGAAALLAWFFLA